MSDYPHIEQVLAYDAAPLVARLLAAGKINPYKRRQDISVDDVLPTQPIGRCRCGCGAIVVLPRRKWATDTCSSFGYAVQGILLGDIRTIRAYLVRRKVRQREEICCATCGGPDVKLELDHKLAVALGGGGMWLENYQLLCAKCHLAKTSIDRKLISAYRKSLKNAI